MHVLPNLQDVLSRMMDLNSSGTYVGTTIDISNPNDYVYGGFIGSNLSASRLNYAGFPETRAFEINDIGWFIGTWQGPNNARRGFVARGPEIQDLGLFPGFAETWVGAINNSNTVVGGAANFSEFETALIWPNGSLVPQDLNDFVTIPNGTFIQAHRINNAGQILAAAKLNNGEFEYYRLDPIQEWTHDGDGTWSVASNWFGPIPNALQHAANFKSAITAPATIVNDSPHRVGTITFESAHRYTLAGTAAITLDDFNAGRIDVISGSHVIDAPLFFEGNATIDAAQNAALRISNPQSSPTTVLTKTGAGELTMTHYRAATLSIEAGAARVIEGRGDDSTSRVDSLSIAPSATFDLADSAMVIDYSGASPQATIRGYLIQGYNNGDWIGDGINSSIAATIPNRAIGIAEASEIGALATFAGQSIDSTSVLLRYTLYGDANLDRIVDIADFALLGANFNATNSTWSRGDFNYDQITDIGDFALLAANFNHVLPADLSGVGVLRAAAVPEPLCVAALIPLAPSRRLRRSLAV